MKTIFITGANRGIGLEIAKIYKEQGHKLIIAARTPTDELKALNAEIIDNVDLTSSAGLQVIKKEVGATSLDLLINNAGLFENEHFGEIDYGSIQKQFEINTLAPLKLTETLAPQMNKGGIVAMITSRMGSIADNTSGSYYGYRMSKAALNMAGVTLAHELRPRDISVALIHPGYVKTRMTGWNGDITPDQSARGIVSVIEKINIQNTGQFWHSNGQELPW